MGYRQTTKTQEKVIAKLEKILENSLQEVQKAQRAQEDVERLKTDNARLRERCSHIVARRKYEGGGAEEADELQRQIASKDDEICRLEGVVRELQTGRQDAPEAPELTQGRTRLAELESTRAEWEQRCTAAEHRLQMLQMQLTESSRRYGGEISTLTVEVAKRDAKIVEL